MGTRTCERCKALNGAGFARCIRCGAGLAPLARGVDRLNAGVDPAEYPVTKILLAMTFLAFALQAYLQLRRGESIGVVLFSAGAPQSRALLRSELLRLGALDPTLAAVLAQPFRLLSAMFVHKDALHVVLNMLAFTSAARDAEPLVGSARLALT